MAARFGGKSVLSYSPVAPVAERSLLDLGVGDFAAQTSIDGGDMFGASELLRTVSDPADSDKPMTIELAVAAMEELTRMAQTGEPLWIPDTDGLGEVLNDEEYGRTFPRGIGPKALGLRSEASRDSAVVIMNHNNLVETLMDVVEICH